jgi:acyl-CoA thioester hydrolase
VGEPARLTLKVRHYEVDLYGHVNHANYVHYLEVARVEALEAVGLSLPEMRRQGYLIVAVDLSVRYHSPAYSGDTLEVTTHIREIRGARSVWAQEIREATSRRLAVTAEVTGAFMTEGGRPVRVPPAFVEKLSALRVSDTRPPGQRADSGHTRPGAGGRCDWTSRGASAG